MQQTSTIFVWPSAFQDCTVNETLAIPDVNAKFLPSPDYYTYDWWNNGVPYSEQETTLLSLQLDWAITDNLDFTSITATMDLESDTMEVYDYAWGNGASHAFNGYEMFSQEFRLDSSYDGAPETALDQQDHGSRPRQAATRLLGRWITARRR